MDEKRLWTCSSVTAGTAAMFRALVLMGCSIAVLGCAATESRRQAAKPSTGPVAGSTTVEPTAGVQVAPGFHSPPSELLSSSPPSQGEFAGQVRQASGIQADAKELRMASAPQLPSVAKVSEPPPVQLASSVAPMDSKAPRPLPAGPVVSLAPSAESRVTPASVISEPIPEPTAGPDANAASLLPSIEDLPAPPAQPAGPNRSTNEFPITLPAALQLAGANNLHIALATERINEAQARLQGANTLWLPSLNGGVGYNIHQGQIQDTRGDILDVRRSSLFVGGGPSLGASPLTGGANGPARFFLGLPLTDAIFERLAERQLVSAANAKQAATFNDELLAVSAGYLELVRAEGQVAIVREAVGNAAELVRLVEARVRAGTAPPADELRAKADLASRQRRVFREEEAVRNISAELVRLLNLPPGLTLMPAEAQPVAIELVDTEQPLPSLIAQGLTSRPELAAHQAVVRATVERLRQEQWRPLIPHIELAHSVGGFGGGPGNFFGDFDGRNDFDALAVWELRGLGFGNAALVRQRRSENRQAYLTVEQVRNVVAAEVTESYYQARLREDQIEAAQHQIEAAAEALPLNFKGILGGQLRAIEALQAIDALIDGQTQYLTSVIDYNRAQFQLLRALGVPPGMPDDKTL